MRSIVNRLAIGLGVLGLCVTTTTSWAQGGPGGAIGGGGFSAGRGELRGLSNVEGRVLCASCTLNEVRAARPDAVGLYQLRHRQGQVVMQLTKPDDPHDAAWWDAISGIVPVIDVRTPDALFTQLMEERNQNRLVALQGLLRPTRTYDVAYVNFLEGPRKPLALGRANEAADRAEAAAARADAAASRTERAAERLEATAKNMESQFETAMRK